MAEPTRRVHTGADFEAGRVHAQAGVEVVPGVEVVDSREDDPPSGGGSG